MLTNQRSNKNININNITTAQIVDCQTPPLCRQHRHHPCHRHRHSSSSGSRSTSALARRCCRAYNRRRRRLAAHRWRSTHRRRSADITPPQLQQLVAAAVRADSWAAAAAVRCQLLLHNKATVVTVATTMTKTLSRTTVAMTTLARHAMTCSVV